MKSPHFFDPRALVEETYREPTSQVEVATTELYRVIQNKIVQPSFQRLCLFTAALVVVTISVAAAGALMALKYMYRNK